MSPAETARTCVGCREKRHPDALVRLAAVDFPPFVVPDLRGKLGGRGIWVTPSPECLRAAVKSGFSRALKKSVSVNYDTLLEQILGQLQRRLQGLVLGGLRSGHLIAGQDAVEQKVRERAVATLWIAEDAGRREHLEGRRDKLGARLMVFGTKAELGALVGRERCATIGILDEGLASATHAVSVQIAGLRETPRPSYEDRASSTAKDQKQA